MVATPPELTELLHIGVWPRNAHEARQQNLKPIVPAQVIRLLAPEEDTIYFEPPPFLTVAQWAASTEGSFWTDPRSRIDQLDPERTLIIGDFGLGSDAPLALDYREREVEPRVIRLRWSSSGTEWVEVAQTFDDFLKKTGITKAAQPGATDNPGDAQ